MQKEIENITEEMPSGSINQIAQEVGVSRQNVAKMINKPWQTEKSRRVRILAREILRARAARMLAAAKMITD